MNTIIYIENLAINVCRKKVKNINLSVKKNGQIAVSMPYRCAMTTVENFVKSRLSWIRQTQEKINSIVCRQLKYENNETHFLWGKPYCLLIEVVNNIGVKIQENQIIIRLSEKNNTAENRQYILDKFYANAVKNQLSLILEKWVTQMNTPQPKISIRKMKTRWGSCSPNKKSIRINSELAKYPSECLQYVLVHELAHFFVKGHGDDFIAIIDKNMPNWQKYKKMLDNHTFQAA
ncbi:MAG: M48 family metallopeptidase [Neisseriaceae bacterium]|nr:M48 family metallopeptidase [Neisseriaceae bacterium]